MTSRDRTILVALIGLVVAAAGWFTVVAPERNEAAKLQTQITKAQAQLQTDRASALAAQSAESAYRGNYTAVAKLGEAVPEDDSTGSLIVQLQSAASKADVDFRSLALAASAAGSAAIPTPAGSTPASATGTSASPTTSASTSTTTGGASASTGATPSVSAVTAAASAATLPPGAAIGSAGFPTIPFTFTFQGNFFHLADFLGRIQRFVVATRQRISVSGRLMTLNAISLAAGPQGFPQITATISATTYLLPAGQGLVNGASAAAPAAGSTPVSTTGSSRAAVPATAAITPAP